jgi:light-regulated signal transduction histidine kinase (bacteriophytochrome)
VSAEACLLPSEPPLENRHSRGHCNPPRVSENIENAQGERCYCVKDNGVGFNPSYGDKLYDSFQRLHSPEEFPGMGIGLACVARVVNRHEGRIWAKSAEGQGAAFFFTLGAPL